LEKYNPIKFKHQSKAKVAPSTEKEVNSRGLFNPFKNESVNESTLKPGTKLRYEKNNFVIDYVVDKEYKAKDGFTKYILKVVKSNYPNKIKVGSTEEYEDSRLTGLIRNRVIKFVKNESVNEAKSVKTYNSLDDFEKVAKIGNVFYLGNDGQFQRASNKDYFKVVDKKTDGSLVVSNTTSNKKYTISANRYDEKVHLVNEENPGLWANIRAKRARGEKPAHGNSQAHKDAVAAAKKINKDEAVNEYDEWKNTRTQSKNIFRMLKQKYSNNISKMRDGLEDILKQNKTKNDQAEVMRDEFNKFFKIKTETVTEAKYSDQTGIKSSLLNEPEFTNLFQPKVFNWMRGKDVKIFKVQNYSTTFTITDGKMEIVVNISKPMSVIKPYGRVRREVKDLFSKTETVNEVNTIIKSKDGKLHNYPNLKKNDVINFLTKKGMKHVSNEKDLKSNMDFYIVESVNENFSNDDIAKIKGAVEGASSFMGIGSELKKLGMKYDFSTSPLPVYMIKKGSKTFVLVNKKYAEKPDFVVGTTAGGLLEGNSTNESTPKIKMNNLDWGKSTVERNANLDKYGSLKTDKEREEFLKKLKGESINEGNAFGMAVTKAKQEGKKEFEFNGKIYKVKKGSYEKNEAAKKAVTENTHVVVSMSKSGYGTLMSKPVSQKDAEKLKKATTPVRGEDLKVITVSDAKSLKNKLVGRELLNK
jgi:hypothetical protein